MQVWSIFYDTRGNHRWSAMCDNISWYCLMVKSLWWPNFSTCGGNCRRYRMSPSMISAWKSALASAGCLMRRFRVLMASCWSSALNCASASKRLHFEISLSIRVISSGWPGWMPLSITSILLFECIPAFMHNGCCKINIQLKNISIL